MLSFNINYAPIQQQIVIPNILNESMVSDIKEKGYNYVPYLFTPNELASSYWKEFKKSWSNLAQDDHMNDGGKYRERRYSVFSWNKEKEQILLEPHQPHYQSLTYNNVNGGVYRNFQAFEPHILKNKCLSKMLEFSASICNTIAGPQDWHIESHQFRINCQIDSLGKPTPEGIHQDGRDYVFIMFIDKYNVKGGKTIVYDLQKSSIDCYTMRYPSEMIIFDDHTLFHSVSDIKPKNPLVPGYRDVFVATFLKVSDSRQKYAKKT